jgi:hypothetical protein
MGIHSSLNRGFQKVGFTGFRLRPASRIMRLGEAAYQIWVSSSVSVNRI